MDMEKIDRVLKEIAKFGKGLDTHDRVRAASAVAGVILANIRTIREFVEMNQIKVPEPLYVDDR